MKCVRNKSSKVVSVLLAGALLASLLPVSVFAAEPNTPKEEVVYVNLTGDGTVKEIYVVNIFDLDEDGRIVDYGRYDSLRNMTTTDQIHRSGDTVTIDAKAGKLYYEGKLDSNVIPWNISIHYYMNGREYTAEEIAGKSGALKITVSITENKNCESNFFDGFALQTSLTLNTNQCRNIVAEDATIANVGRNKQLTYTILPGKGADIVVTADVSDFEMDAVSINGIPLNLKIEIDDGALMGQVQDLLTAIEQLDDGAGDLKNGVSDLQNGVKTDLHSGVQDLQDGAEQLHDGAAGLKDGGDRLYSGASELQNGAASLDEGIQSLNQGVTQMQTALNTLHRNSPALTEGSAAYKAALEQLQTAVNDVSVTSEDLSALGEASSAIKTGIDELVSGVTALQQGVSFSGYKSVMAANGLDIEYLRQQNTAAMSSLQSIVNELNNFVSVLQRLHIDTSSLESQIAQLSNLSTLLGANNAAISGTDAYLTEVNRNLSTLLDGATTLQTKYTEFDAVIGTLVDRLGGLAYQMGALTSAVNTLVSEYEKVDDGITDYTGAVAQIVAGYAQITEGTQQLVTGSSALKTGADRMYQGTGELLNGIVEIYNGTGTLKDGTGELDEGVAKLLTATMQLYEGTGTLKNGTSAMRKETSGMDGEINAKIEDLLSAITGGDVELSSFVSVKNTNIKGVQFVIQTETIHKD